VAYVGPIDFPSSAAAAQRMMGVIQALTIAGDRVSVGSGGHGSPDAASANELRLDVTMLGELPDPQWSSLRRITRGLTWGAATRDWIREMDPAPDVVLVYGTALGYLARLIPLARSLRIPIVIDVTEWYESSHLPGGRWGPFAMANRWSMRSVAPKVDGVIAISSFLESYFAGQGLATVRVPPLFSFEEARQQGDADDQPLRLCYVGSPGQKDKQTLDNLVRLPGELGCDRDELRIHVAGVGESAALALLGDGAAAAVRHECLVFHGRVNSTHARQIIADSHFSVLQRGEERYARAGYPSKIPESLLLGTPVIANLTSDLANVLVDGRNSRILADASLASLASAVSEILVEPYRFSRNTIASEARSRFAPSQYAQSIHNFLASRRL
jgi:glycosyltransferase involved in cell wall biosynthesis